VNNKYKELAAEVHVYIEILLYLRNYRRIRWDNEVNLSTLFFQINSRI